MDAHTPHEGDTSLRGRAKIPRTGPTRTLEKGLFVLGLFDIEHPEWTLRELREQAGLPEATARRLVKTLEAAHWLTYNPDSAKYHLGPSVLRGVYLALSHTELVRLANPFLVRLTEETTESSGLAVWTEDGALMLDSVPTARAFKPETYGGLRLEGTASADAQVLIAFGSEQSKMAILARPQERRTRHTVVDPVVLREKWRRAREEGVAVDREEWNDGAMAVAAPVFDRNRQVRASLSVVFPPERADKEQMQRYTAAVKRAAAELSQALGYQGD